MKLYEEFKEYETMWEDTSAPVLKTFGRKTYDLSKPDELKAWVEANVIFQMKRHPGRYADPGFSGVYHSFDIRRNILDNLVTKLTQDGVDKSIRDRVWDLRMDNVYDYDRKLKALRTEEVAPKKIVESTQKSWFVLAVDYDPEGLEELDIDELEFYRWGVEQDVGYEIAAYEDLIAHGDKRLTLDEAKDRAREVINMTYADEVFIIHVTEDNAGNVISAEYVTEVN